MRTARIAGLVSLALIGVFVVAVPASATSLGISKFKVTPAYASGGGSSVTFTAKTKHATSCRIKSSPDIKGMPAALSCKDGSARKVFKVPANRSSKVRKIVFTLTAKHGSLRVKADVTVNQDPALATITSLTRTPATANVESSTAVKVSAKLTHAETCTLSASPALSGLPASASCTSGSFAKTVTVPANSTAGARTFTLTLSAKNSIGKITKKSVKVTQSAETAVPSATLSPTPGSLPAGGGNLMLASTVAHATSCHLTSSPSVGSATCANGTANHGFSIPANKSSGSKPYTFTLTASNPLGTATTALTMVQPPAAAPAVGIPSISLSPSSLTAGGGSVTVQATVTGATECTLTTSTPGHAGTPSDVECSDGTISQPVTITPNTDSNPKTYTFHIAASGPGGSATGDLIIEQPVAKAPAPTVVSMTPDKTSIPQGGTTVSVSAVLTNGTNCTLSGSDGTTSVGTSTAVCTTSYSHAFAVPATVTARTITFTLTVTGTGTGGTATGMLTMTQPGVGGGNGVQVNSLKVANSTVTSDGGSFTVTASVSNATTCTMGSSPNIGSLSSTACTSGTVTHTFSDLPANTTGSNKPYTITVTANGSGGTSATGTATVTQPPTTPSVVSIALSSSTVDYHGGLFTVNATVAHAKSCTLTAGGASVTAGAAGSCAGGTYTGSVTIPANTSPTDTNTVTLTVGATGDGGSASGTLTIHVPPAPPTITNLAATAPDNTGKVTVTATLGGIDGSSTCALSSNPSTGVTGAGTQTCASNYTRTVTLPSGSGTYTLTLNVTGPGGTASATVNVNRT